MWITWIAGRDSLSKHALPTGEFFHPISLSMLALLIINDWLIKSSDWAHTPTGNLLAGKLSDVAGLVFFPLLLTAALDGLLYGLYKMGASIDFTLRPKKIAATLFLTAFAFTSIKLIPELHHLAIRCFALFGIKAQIMMDASDLIALPALLISWRIARWEISRIPLGRLEFILSQKPSSTIVYLQDSLRLAKNPEEITAFAKAMDRYIESASPKTEEQVERALKAVRDLSLNSEKVG